MQSSIPPHAGGLSSGAYLLPGFRFEIQLPAALGSCMLEANHGSEVRFNGFEI